MASVRTGEVLWEVRNLRKAYPGVVANDDVSLSLRASEIQALLGENGCGKSTLIKTLSGAHRPDSGTILRGGRPVTLASPVRARELGIATVFQEFSGVATLTVAENIHLGRWPGPAAGVDWPGMRDAARRTFATMGLAIDPDAMLGELSVAQQQLVEIAKAIAADAAVLILDEPTTALGPAEIGQLHALLHRLKAQGRSILYVSHRLDEVVALVDVATVMRNGRVVSAAEDTPIAIAAFVAAMVGADVGEHYPKERNSRPQVMLEVDGIATDAGVVDASFAVHAGEVLGLGGVLGAGRTSIARALFGLDPLRRGRIRLDGRELRLGGPIDAIAAGLALLTENRKADGLFLNLDGTRNLTVANLGALVRGGRLDLAAERSVAARLIERLQITPTAAERSVDTLSGGNQQKVIIGRWLYTGARIFILDEPTQGIDIGAKIAVYRLINEITRSGAAVILISADDEELLAMADRIALVRHGRVTRTLPVSEVDRAELRRSGQTELAA